MQYDEESDAEEDIFTCEECKEEIVEPWDHAVDCTQNEWDQDDNLWQDQEKEGLVQ